MSAYPAHREADVALRDGATAHVRPVRPEDEEAILGFLDRDVAQMVRSLATFPLLDGYRGAPKADVAALEEILLRVGTLVEAHSEVVEMDCNPVIVSAEGAIVVDARVRVESPPPAASSRRSPSGMSDVDPNSRRPVRVLVGTDGSEPSLRASGVAAASLPPGTEVRLIVVLSFELDPYTLLGEELEDTPERKRMVHQAVERAVAEPRRAFEEAGHAVSVTHRFGNPADEILAEIEEWQPDLVVVGRRGLTGPGRWLLGSVSDRLVHHATVPVLVAS